MQSEVIYKKQAEHNLQEQCAVVAAAVAAVAILVEVVVADLHNNSKFNVQISWIKT